MNDHNIQRPVFLFSVGQANLSPQENNDNHFTAAEVLNSLNIQHKVLEGFVGSQESDYFLVPEEHAKTVFDLAEDYLSEVIYLDVFRNAWVKTRDTGANGEPIGKLVNIPFSKEVDANARVFVDQCHNSRFEIFN